MSDSQKIRDHMAKFGSITPSEAFKLYNIDSNKVLCIITSIERIDNVRFKRTYEVTRRSYLNNGKLKKVVGFEVIK